MEQRDTPRKLETVERAIGVLDEVQRLGGARPSELADEMGLAPSTVHGYLSTLERNRYLVKDGDEYAIGLKLLNIGAEALVQNRVYKIAKEKVTALAHDTGERAQFIVEEHGIGIYIHTAVGKSAVQVDARIGKETYLHASAAGKAILAYLPDERVDAAISRWGMPELTPNTITDRETLAAELEGIREGKVSFNDNESIQGLRAVGAPVLLPDGTVVGSLSISGPSNRVEGEWYNERIPKLLLGATNEMELRLAYQ